MTTLTIVQAESAATEHPPRFTEECPNWMFVQVCGNVAHLMGYCGRHLQEAEATEFVASNDWTGVPDGMRVIEGALDIGLGALADWVFETTREITDAERQRLTDGESIWEPSYFEPVPSMGTIQLFGYAEFRALYEAAQAWTQWRSQIGGLSLGAAETALVEMVEALSESPASVEDAANAGPVRA